MSNRKKQAKHLVMTRQCDRPRFNPYLWIVATTLIASGCQALGITGELPAQQSQSSSASNSKPHPKPDPKHELPPEPAPRPDTGLAVGQTLPKLMGSFDDRDEIACLTCASKNRSQLLVFGIQDDPVFLELLQDVDAVIQKYKPQSIVAFGVVTNPSAEGLASHPSVEGWSTKLKTLKRELRIKMKLGTPITTPTENDSFAKEYGIRVGPTLLLSDPTGAIQYAAIAPPDLSQLDERLKKIASEK